MKKYTKLLSAAIIVMMIATLMTSCLISSLYNVFELPEIEEAEIYNENGVSIVTKKMHQTSSECLIAVAIINESDKNIMVETKYVMVNGIIVNAGGMFGISAEVPANRKLIDDISLYKLTLEDSGISVIVDIDVVINVIDNDTGEIIDTSDLLSIPTSESGYQQEVDLDGFEVYNANGVKIICKEPQKSDYEDAVIQIIVQNTSDTEVLVYFDDVYVNGYADGSILYSQVFPGCYSHEQLYVSLDYIEENNIKHIKNLEFSIRLINNENSEEIDSTDTITVEFE